MKAITTFLMGKTEIISSKIRNDTRVSKLPTLFQYSDRCLNQNNQMIEREIQVRKYQINDCLQMM